MKFVKKLLRLLPFILFIMFTIISCFTAKFEFTSIGLTQSYFQNLVTAIIDGIQSLTIELGFSYGGDFTFFDPLFDFFHDTLGIYGRVFDICIQLMIYELFLSLLFLMFDVFNFILGIANKWIKKGGNLDD